MANTAYTNNLIITIGGVDITVKHQNFSSLNIKRTASDAADSFTLNVLDDATFDIETLLLNSKNSIQIKYVDDNGNIYKELNGTIIKMKNSFVDNRNMLTLEGYVSIGIEDKYQPVSNSWNQIPIFDWSGWNSGTDTTDYVPFGKQDDLGESFWNQVIVDGVVSTGSTIKFVWNSIFNKDNAKAMQTGYKEYIDRLFNEHGLEVDDDGKYYIPSKYSNEGKELKSTGVLSLPMKPGDVIKLIFFGGEYSDLFTADAQTYKDDSNFWNNVSKIQLYFIGKWLEAMGKREPLSPDYKKGIWEDTEYVNDDLSQQRESNFTYIYKTLLDKCVYIDGKNIYSNYYITFRAGGFIDLKRLDASEEARERASRTQYVYYGKFQPVENFGVMTSFSASIDVLTSMITNGANTSKDADISTINLVTGESSSVSVVTDKDEVKEAVRHTAHWGEVTYNLSNANVTSSGTRAIAQTFAVAAANCYKAEATITGFNTLEPLDFIDIVVVPTTQSDGSQLLHHTSGKYYILSLEDNIEGGNWTTRLGLIKNIQSKGKTAVVTEASHSSDK